MDSGISYQIAVVVGSIRRGAYSRMTAEALMALAPPSLSFQLMEIGDLPLYNQDADESPPQQWVDFRDQVRQADAVLFVTPEHNRSMPAALKNALDIGSRPYGQIAWSGKPGAVVSVSPGAMGGFGANHHLRQSLVFLNVPVMQQPEAYIGKAATLFTDTGELTDDRAKELFKSFMAAFERWIGLLASYGSK